MSPVWLIFRKDLRRLWPMELALAALTIFLACFPRLGIDPHEDSLVNGTELIRVVLLGLLAVLLMQADLAVTDRADWITRPIRARAVVAGKVLFVFLTLALPAGVIAALAARPYDVSWGLCAELGLKIAGMAAVVALFFGLIGAATSSLIGAVNLSVGGAVGLAIVVPYATLRSSHQRLFLAWGYPAICACIVAALVGVLAFHYRYRRTPLTLAAAFAVLAALFLVQRRLSYLPRVSAPAGVALHAKSPRAFLGGAMPQPFPLGDEVVVGMQAAYVMPPEPDGEISVWKADFAAADGRHAGGILPPGASIHSDESVVRNISSAWNRYPAAAKAWFGLEIQGEPRPSLIAVLALPGSRLAPLAGAKGVLDLDCTYYPTRLAEPGFLALEAGAALQLTGYHVRLESIRAASGPRIEIGLLTIQIQALDSSYHELVWALVNDATGEVSLAETGPDYRSASSVHAREIREGLIFAHRWRRGSGEPATGVDPSWLKSARLEYLQVDRERGERFQAVISGFTLPAVGGSR
ncbi:MAG TPA: hypothetical protein VHV47_09550 [Opitutaceae bacterium]|jgi:hypothetical protein|nr:hypothetical protein [Opitutaceae bacterium]